MPWTRICAHFRRPHVAHAQLAGEADDHFLSTTAMVRRWGQQLGRQQEAVAGEVVLGKFAALPIQTWS